MKLYQELATCWSVLTPPGTYDFEAVQIVSLLQSKAKLSSLLELGSGIGALVESFPPQLEVVLMDAAPAMLAESKKRNPHRQHLCMDMTNFAIERSFDAILLHDAVMYLTSRADLLSCFSSAYRHLHDGGSFLIIPDTAKGYFEEHAVSGGAEAGDQAVQLLEWHWDPDPRDEQIQVEFSILWRQNGVVSSVHETHIMGLYTLDTYCALLEEAGFSEVELIDPEQWGGLAILARR
jgi:ubiquinone/menaquinone biosynthesis C-methylase UbiE